MVSQHIEVASSDVQSALATPPVCSGAPINEFASAKPLASGGFLCRSLETETLKE